MSFNNSLKIEFVSMYRGKVLEDITYTNDGISITIKKGFITDGASIPRWLWSFTGSPFVGKYRKAAVLHDYIYRYRLYNKKDADLLFYKIMLESGVSKFKAKLFYLALYFFGRKDFKKK